MLNNHSFPILNSFIVDNSTQKNDIFHKYEEDSCCSPSQITVNNTNDFDFFLKKINRSNKVKNGYSKNHILFNEVNKKKYFIKSQKSHKISLLDSQMNEIFKDSFLNKQSINNFANLPSFNFSVKKSNQNTTTKFEISHLSKNFKKLKNEKYNDKLSPKNNMVNSSLAMNKENISNFTKLDWKILNNNDKFLLQNSNFNENAMKKKDLIALTSIEFKSEKIEMTENSFVNKFEKKSTNSNKSRFEFHSILNKKKNKRYLETELSDCLKIFKKSDVLDTENFEEIENNKKINYCLQTPESINSLTTVDRGFAFLNSCNFNFIKLNNHHIQKNLLENENKLKAKLLYNKQKILEINEEKNKAVDFNDALKTESSCNYFNINTSGDFLKSLKLNKNLKIFLQADIQIVQNYAFSILGEDVEKEIEVLKNDKSNGNINQNKENDYLKESIKKKESFVINDNENVVQFHPYNFPNTTLKGILYELLLLCFFFFSFISVFLYKSYLKKNKNNQSSLNSLLVEKEQKIKIVYKNNLKEFSGFILN